MVCQNSKKCIHYRAHLIGVLTILNCLSWHTARSVTNNVFLLFLVTLPSTAHETFFSCSQTRNRLKGNKKSHWKCQWSTPKPIATQTQSSMVSTRCVINIVSISIIFHVIPIVWFLMQVVARKYGAWIGIQGGCWHFSEAKLQSKIVNQ